MSETPLIEVTSLAVSKLQEVLSSTDANGSLLRVIATPGPNGGFQYMLGAETEAKDDDLVINANEINILVDSQSVPYVEGSKIDYVESLTRSGFVISNPNFKGGGGCGGGGGGGGGRGGGGG